MRDGNTARVAEVFDFGPLFAFRARVGQAIPLVPPFGAVFVAWSDDDAEAWIARADATLEEGGRDRYRRSLDEIRRRGYSVSIRDTSRPGFAEAIETLTSAPDSDETRRSRDALVREMMRSGYLAADLDPAAAVRVGHVSAPVFDRHTLDYVLRRPYDTLYRREMMLSLPELGVKKVLFYVAGTETVKTELGEILCWQVVLKAKVLVFRFDLTFLIEKEYPYRYVRFGDKKRQMVIFKYEKRE